MALYAFQQSEIIVVPGRIHCFIIGMRHFLVLERAGKKRT